jgi:hypothetical protein
MTYLRFVVASRDAHSGVAGGVIQRAYALGRAKEVAPDDRRSIETILAWFEKNLAAPTRFNRTRSKGYYRRRTKGIAWFRDTAHEHLSRMHDLKRILEAYGESVELIREDRIGYVVYEDQVQVVAEPFSDTRTGVQR